MVGMPEPTFMAIAGAGIVRGRALASSASGRVTLSHVRTCGSPACGAIGAGARGTDRVLSVLGSTCSLSFNIHPFTGRAAGHRFGPSARRLGDAEDQSCARSRRSFDDRRMDRRGAALLASRSHVFSSACDAEVRGLAARARLVDRCRTADLRRATSSRGPAASRCGRRSAGPASPRRCRRSRSRCSPASGCRP